MKRIILAALALGTVALGMGAPASASHVTVRGGCGFDAGTDPSGEIANPDTYTGVIYAAVAAASSTPDENPLAVTVTCTLKVNAGTVDVEVFTGSGVAGGAGDTSYVRHEGDVVELCTRIQAGDYDTETCGGADHITIPPDEFWQLVDEVFATIDPLLTEIDNALAPVYAILTDLEVTYVDPLVCPILAAIGPVGDPATDLVAIADDGDVYLFGVKFWDCPPYGA